MGGVGEKPPQYSPLPFREGGWGMGKQPKTYPFSSNIFCSQKIYNFIPVSGNFYLTLWENCGILKKVRRIRTKDMR